MTGVQYYLPPKEPVGPEKLDEKKKEFNFYLKIIENSP
jgi:hypothetical protein